MPLPHLLYSTNTKIKLMLNEQFRNDLHFCWCGECFDTSKTHAYTRTRMTPPSSDPYAIYRSLAKDVKGQDRHSSKIAEQRLSLITLAGKWKESGELTESQAEEMAYIAKNSEITDFQPLLYIIPTHKVEARLEEVAVTKRASMFGREFIISDLARSEFDIVEIDL